VLYRTRGTIHGKVWYRSKVHILSYSLCFVSFRYLVWM
jgi:hypothetical protein